jgi:hypothetical protein
MMLKSLLVAAVVAVLSAQVVSALDVQLQLQLTTYEGQPVNEAKLSIAAASFLAIKHFNTRSSPVIDLSNTCDSGTQLNVEVVDTQSDEKVALLALLTKSAEERPEIIIGALTSYETVPVALVASVQGVPMISYGATSQSLDDSARYPTFLRTIPSDKTVADAVCQ